jgi:hypothetical protein
MDPPPRGHLREETLEAYALRRLRGSALSSVDEHLGRCPACRRRLQEIEAFISALRGAVQDFTRHPLDYTHHTKLGPIRLHAFRQGSRWMALVSGAQIEYGQQFDRIYDANQFVMEAFAQLFPEHRCTGKCRPEPPRPRRR